MLIVGQIFTFPDQTTPKIVLFRAGHTPYETPHSRAKRLRYTLDGGVRKGKMIYEQLEMALT
jgi:hypothetical protein